MVHRWHTTTTLTKCVVWCCGCCFEYPQQWQQHILTKCVVEWCCGSQHPQHHTTTHVVEMCCCTVLWVLFRVPTTTNVLLYGVVGVTTHNTIHFVKMCCCGYSKQHPQHHTTTHFNKMCCCGYSKQHPQHHTTTHFVKMCCCGYSKQHPQHHTTTHFVKMCCCGYSKQHHTTTHFVNVVVVCHLWWCGCCFEYPQFTPTSLCCCCVSPMMMWVLFRVPAVYTHITLTTHFVKMCCCGYSKQHPQHHTTTHFVKICCCGYSKQVDPQHHTTTHLVNVVVVCHLWWCGCCFEYPQFTPTSLCCCCVSPMMMWVLFRVPAVYTHITLLLLCVTNDDVGVVSSTRSLHPHHFNNTLC